MKNGFFSKKNFIVVGSLVLIIAVIVANIYFYFQVYLTRQRFAEVKTTINAKEFEDKGYKKIENQEEKFSFFVPDYWYEVDREKPIHSDTLNGAMVYIETYPNNLGVLGEEMCANFSKLILEKFAQSSLYSNSETLKNELSKINNLDTCALESKATIASKEFEIKQYYIFREYQIYHIFLQYPSNLPIQKEIGDNILKSISIEKI